MDSIIDEYVKLIESQLDAPREFIEASAYYLVSSILGPMFSCRDLPGGIDGAKPNVWFILSSIPGRTRRSTLSNYCQFVYKKALQKFYMEKLGLDETTAKRDVFNTIIEEGTPEGIVDHVEVTNLDLYTIVSTEFGSVLQRMGSRDYTLGVSTLYSKLYYGEGYSMMLSLKGKDARSRYLKPGIYVTMFCGMQEANEYLNRTMSRQGLLRRIMLVACLPSEIKSWRPPLERGRCDIYQSLGKIINKFVENALEISRNLERCSLLSFDMIFHPKAEDVVNAYARKHDKNLESEFGVTDANIYMQSFWEHLSKLSMLQAISRMSFKIDTHGETIGLVEEKDVIKALDFLERATKHNRDIINNLEEQSEKITTYRHPIERVYSLVESVKEIKRSDILRKSNMTKKVLEGYIETLIAQERIIPIVKLEMGKQVQYYKIIEK